MNKDVYASIGFGLIWCVMYIFVPLGVAITGRLLSEKLLQSQPKRQRKKRLIKNRLNK
ncbi:MAG: hypothetical protein ACYDG2_02015 [Ruminiclostridium sp.]